MKNMKIKLIEKKLSENNEVSYLTFKIDNNFNFKAGQFVMLDNKIIKRAYSIASIPSFTEKEGKICFYVKKASENGMSKYLTQDIQVGDELDLIGPFGNMFIKEKTKKKEYLFISIGSGIASIISIYENLIKNGDYKNIYNLYQERYFENIVEDVFKKMNSFQSENVKNLFFLSRCDHELCEKGYIHSKLNDTIEQIEDLKNLEVYMCGKPSIVDELTKKLQEYGIKNIYFEKY